MTYQNLADLKRSKEITETIILQLENKIKAQKIILKEAEKQFKQAKYELYKSQKYRFENKKYLVLLNKRIKTFNSRVRQWNKNNLGKILL